VRNRIDFAPPNTERGGIKGIIASPSPAIKVVRVRRMDAEIYDTPPRTSPRTHMLPARTQLDEINWD
jgi:hypothetical protein